MKTYQVYECEKCGIRSETFDEIVVCEASHLGLTAKEWRKYNDLQYEVKTYSHIVSRKNNDETRKNLDVYIERLVKFEEEHGLISCR